MGESEPESSESLRLRQARFPAGTAAPDLIAGKVPEHRVGADRHLGLHEAGEAPSFNGGVGSDLSQDRSAQARSDLAILVVGAGLDSVGGGQSAEPSADSSLSIWRSPRWARRPDACAR